MDLTKSNERSALRGNPGNLTFRPSRWRLVGELVEEVEERVGRGQPSIQQTQQTLVVRQYSDVFHSLATGRSQQYQRLDLLQLREAPSSLGDAQLLLDQLIKM